MEMDAAIQGQKHNILKKLNICLSKKALIILFNCLLLTIGQIGGPLLVRIYFLNGGKRKWLTSWLLTAGFPCLILPISISYAKTRAKLSASKFLVTPRLFVASAILGCLLGIDSYFYTFGMSYLPVSVSSLLGSSQLAFTSIFAYFVVKHKFTHYSINAVVLLTFGSVVLGLHMNGDRPSGESNANYTLGFFMTLAGAALHGFIMPALEFAFKKAEVVVTFDLVLQVQFLVSMFATMFCTIPMIINKDFQAIPKEAAEFELGPMKYYMILGVAAIALQCMMIGSIGVIFSTSSLFGGILTSLLVPVQQIFAVICLTESFSGEKGMALAMCLWGFASYFYGEYKVNHKQPDVGQDQPEHEEV
ncbi:hypothetical protein ACH5RR_034614 [Cinchona calisaya]|uniref:Probable purine permease n=1 Tax=Cinchona calisaya TaxID=153742 RepID=A0ABD2YCM9_9GENT